MHNTLILSFRNGCESDGHSDPSRVDSGEALHKPDEDIGEQDVDYGERRFSLNQHVAGVILWTLVILF